MKGFRIVLLAFLASCSSPNFADEGENFGRFEIETLIDGLASEFDRAEYSSGFRAPGRLNAGWVNRVRNWEAAKRHLMLKVNPLKNENLSRAVADILIRSMLAPGGAQRMNDLRAARRQIDRVERIFETLND